MPSPRKGKAAATPAPQPASMPSVASSNDDERSKLDAEVISFDEDSIPYEEVAAEAYALYCARGYDNGDDLGDWLAAEQIVRDRRRNRF
jgi:hypothetical protein